MLDSMRGTLHMAYLVLQSGMNVYVSVSVLLSHMTASTAAC